MKTDLTTLAEKLHLPLTQAWEIALKHNYWVAGVDTVLFFLGLLLLVFCIKLWPDTTDYTKDPAVRLTLCAVGIGLGVLLAVVGGVDAFARYSQPVWCTMQDIAGLLKVNIR